MPVRYRVLAALAAGCGLRQGELFGLAVSDIYFLRGEVSVNRQVKIVGNKLVFALPKGRKTRTVPLPKIVALELAPHLQRFPARPITLPWETPAGDAVTAPLLVTGREGTALKSELHQREGLEAGARRGRRRAVT